MSKIVFLSIFLPTLGALLCLGFFWGINAYYLFKNEEKIINEFYLEQEKIKLKQEISTIFQHISYESSHQEQQLKSNLKKEVYYAYEVLDNLYNTYHKQYSDEMVKNILLTTLENLHSAPDHKYYFVYDINQNLPQIKASFSQKEGQHIPVDDLDTVLKLKEGFSYYQWYKPHHISSQKYAKISFLKLFSPYNFVIGLGYYIDDFEENLKNSLLIELIRNHHHEHTDHKKLFAFISPNDSPIETSPFILNIEKLEGEYITKKINASLEGKEKGIVFYQWYEGGKKIDKMAYLHLISEWGTWIGMTVSLVDIYVQIEATKKKLTTNFFYQLIVIISLIFVISLLIFFLAKRLKKEINTSFTNFSLFFRQAALDTALVEKIQPQFSEFKQLALLANHIILKHKLALNKLQKSEQRFDLAMNAISDGLWDWNIVENHIYVSPRYMSILGYEEGEFSGEVERWFALIHEDDRNNALRQLKKQLDNKTDTHEHEFRIRTKQGGYRWILSRGHVVERDSSGHPNRIIGTHVDITERKITENELTYQRHFLRHIIDLIPNAIFVKNKQGHYILANKKMAELLNTNPEEMIGKSDQDFLHSTEAKILAHHDHDAFEYTDIPLVVEEHITHALTGKKHYIQTIKRTLHEEEDIYLLCVALDITAWKHSEIELQQAKEQAELANKSKSEFLANVSHEIRTPMNAILGFADILKQEIHEPQCQEYLAAINSSAKALLVLINDILDLSKVEAGKLTLEYSAINILHILKDIHTVFFSKIEEKKLDYSLECPKDFPPSLLLDENRLRQILLNIIGNAIKFTASGYIKVTCHFFNEENGKVSITITVEDTGIGIVLSQHEDIFSSFTQQRGQSYSKYGGTGLGLTISKHLATMMGGDITVESEYGEGSIFTVTLPYIEVASLVMEEEAEHAITIDSVVFDISTILIVDDIELNRTLLKAYFTQANLNFLDAENGEQGIYYATKHKPDIILMDIKMPIMNGDKAIELIKKNKETQHIPIVVITASVMKHNTEKIKAECDIFLQKPISKQELFSALMKLLPYHLQEAHIHTDILPETVPPQPIVTALTAEELTTLCEQLDTHYYPLWHELNGVQTINDLETFGEDIHQLGKQFNCEQLIQWGEKLFKQANHFDMDGLTQTMDKFPTLYHDLKKLQKS